MPPAPTIPSYDQAYSQLGNVYDPQTSQVQSEIAQLPGQQQAQMSALDQAKVNAFRDITTGANAKGMLFSGFTPDQQAQYVGTKYLPAVANLNTSFNNTKNSLIDKINQINAARATQAQGIVSDAQKNAADAAYKNAQLQLSYARLGASQARASQPSASQLRQAVLGHVNDQFNQLRGGDGKVSEETWNGAFNDAVAAGMKPEEFWQTFGQYVNGNYAHTYAGYNKLGAYGQKYTTPGRK